MENLVKNVFFVHGEKKLRRAAMDLDIDDFPINTRKTAPQNKGPKKNKNIEI